jgi:glycosyltransferase involved in cell wall biosynthesis
MTGEILSRLRNKHAIVLLGTLELGGSERQALHLARWLQQQGMRVEVWGFGPPEGAARLCTQMNIEWRSLPRLWSSGKRKKLRAITSFAGLLRGARPDVLLPYTDLPNILCGLTWRRGGAGVCLWNQRDIGDPAYSFRVQHLAARMTPCFVANSEQGAAYLQHYLGIAANKIHIIQNGVELAAAELGREGWRRQLCVEAQDLVACMVANVRQPKDHLTLVRAWRQVVDGIDAGQNGASARLVLAGKLMESYPAVLELVNQLDLSDQVQFLGQVQDIAGLLSAADLAVFSSAHEGSPNGVLEAMAAGLPLAATDLPGIRAAVGASGTAFLSPPGDEQRMAANMLALLQDAGLRTRLGEYNRQRVQDEYSLEAMCRTSGALIAAQIPGAEK